MATTTDLAPDRKPATPRRRRPSAATSSTREAQLEEQVSQLQTDLKAIAATLAKLSNEKVSEVRDAARSEAASLQRQGQQVVEDVQEQASAMEQQLKDTIREKPLTAVAAAMGIGFVLALLTRH
jgi:ElaB/YqjD/DUF883 family membrane-anchored ribosome-binding protein